MPEPQRLIAHFDLDSFFVSVEVLNNPELKGKAVVVGGAERGVVAACSYEARKFGIHSGMPSSRAKQLCPHAIFCKGTRSEYSRYSRWVTEIIASKAPVFEKASIDEFYLDLTGMHKFFKPLEWTIALREQIMQETGLPISFGLGANKMIAKMATNQAKPNGYLQVPAGKEKAFLAPLPVEAIPGVGDQVRVLLHKMGIYSIAQLNKAGAAMLEEALGKWGADLHQKSEGIHNREVSNFHEAKSISSENTFDENKTDLDFMAAELVRLTEKVGFELRKDGKVTGCVAVKIRYHDFETTSRQTTIAYTDADHEIIPVLKKLFQQLYKKGRPVRLLGIKYSDLTNTVVQTNIFEDAQKNTAMYKAIDEVKNRFGKTLLKRASSGKSKG
jgi:DNA polymerase-4